MKRDLRKLPNNIHAKLDDYGVVRGYTVQWKVNSVRKTKFFSFKLFQDPLQAAIDYRDSNIPYKWEGVSSSTGLRGVARSTRTQKNEAKTYLGYRASWPSLVVTGKSHFRDFMWASVDKHTRQVYSGGTSDLEFRAFKTARYVRILATLYQERGIPFNPDSIPDLKRWKTVDDLDSLFLPLVQSPLFTLNTTQIEPKFNA